MKVQTTGRILLNSLFRRWRLIVLINLVVLGTILVGSWLWPPIYQASSSIVVLSRGYPELLSPPKGGGASTLIMNPKEEINSEIEIIRSRPVLERVVQELNLTEPKPVEETGVAGRHPQPGPGGVSRPGGAFWRHWVSAATTVKTRSSKPR